MIVYNNQQQLTGHCSFQEYSVLLQSPPRNNGNQGQHAIIQCKERKSNCENKIQKTVLILNNVNITCLYFIVTQKDSKKMQKGTLFNLKKTN